MPDTDTTAAEGLEPGELLPCPFCGAPAMRVDFEDGENAGGSCISCTYCQASSNVEFGRKENLVSNWNRRAPTPPGAVTREAQDWLDHYRFQGATSMDRECAAEIAKALSRPRRHRRPA